MGLDGTETSVYVEVSEEPLPFQNNEVRVESSSNAEKSDKSSRRPLQTL